jgi:predicted Zn finger-like uncharacterized protein
MIVMCEGCETSFQVADRMIKPTGSKVRCSKCRHVFIAYPAAAADTEEPLTLEEELPADAASGGPAGLNEPAEPNEIDAQLDALFREESSGTGDPASVALEPELLDVDELLAGDAPAAGALKAEALGDELELDLDLGLSLEADPEAGAPQGKTPPAAPAGAGEPSFDLGPDHAPSAQAEPEDALPDLEELEISLDDLDRLDEAAAPAAAEAPRQADDQSPELELDLDLANFASERAAAADGAAADADIRAVLESASGTEAMAPGAPVDRSDGSDLERGAAAGATAAAKAVPTAPMPSGEDMLDLSDLEAMLEGGASTKPAAATEGIDLELDLGAAVEDETQGGEMQELDLAGIADAPEAGPAKEAADADELDFSDISGILEEKAPVTAAAGAEKLDEELDLVFDDEPQAAAAKKEETPPSESQEDLMLDLETLLEADEETKPVAQKTAAEMTDDLDLEFAAASGKDEAGDLEIEIEPVDEAVAMPAPAFRPSATAAVAAAAVAGAAGAAAMGAMSGKTTAVTDEFTTDEFTQAGMTGATDLLEAEAAKTAAPKTQKTHATARSGGIRKLLLAAAALVVLVIAALVIPRSLGIQVPYLSDVDIPYLSDLEIPFLGKIFQSQPEDTAGNLKIAPVPESVNAEFIDNAAAGRLCVVKGQVRNAYDHPRSFIRVTAKLYDKNKTVAKTATVYAGNVLSRQELAGQDLAAISARLKNKTGANNLNAAVKPGAAIPFMVVFDGLPDNLDEYSVEVAGSSK